MFDSFTIIIFLVALIWRPFPHLHHLQTLHFLNRHQLITKPDILANSLNTLLYPVQLNRNLSPWPGLGVVILPHLLQYLHLGAAQDGPPSGPSQQGHPAIQDFISSSNFPYPLLSPTLSFLRNIWNEKESLLFYGGQNDAETIATSSQMQQGGKLCSISRFWIKKVSHVHHKLPQILKLTASPFILFLLLTDKYIDCFGCGL